MLPCKKQNQCSSIPTGDAEQIVGRERRRRVSQLDSLDASRGEVFRIIIGPALLD
ncbi:MAG: hypothetical protein QOF62_285 [Pyrinomonadaceae bacterium]|jgi:hypothetical protein|nr:hypothetical protein [Pyrinomonadaceae bacterium]